MDDADKAERPLKNLGRRLEHEEPGVAGSILYGLGGIIDENSPLNPLSLYAKTKLEAEKIGAETDAISFRLGTIFGLDGLPGEPLPLIERRGVPLGILMFGVPAWHRVR